MDSKRKIVIIGGGGHAKVLIEAINSMQEFVIAGIIDSRLPAGSKVLGIEVLGGDDLLPDKGMADYAFAIGIGSMKGDDKRKNIFNNLKEMGYRVPIIRHKSTFISGSAKIGEGSQIMAGTIVQPSSSIGSNCIINTAAVVEHDCILEGHNHISPGVVLGGGVVVGECSMIGLGARLLPGVRIGKHSMVGAGAVVVEDVSDGQTVVGIPAR